MTTSPGSLGQSPSESSARPFNTDCIRLGITDPHMHTRMAYYGSPGQASDMSHLTPADRQPSALQLKQPSAAPHLHRLPHRRCTRYGDGAVVCRDYRKVNAESSTGGDRGCGWSCSRIPQDAVGTLTVYQQLACRLLPGDVCAANHWTCGANGVLP